MSCGDVFQLGSSGDGSQIEPALQDTLVAAIAGLGIVARVLAGTRDIAGLGVDSAKEMPSSESLRQNCRG